MRVASQLALASVLLTVAGCARGVSEEPALPLPEVTALEVSLAGAGLGTDISLELVWNAAQLRLADGALDARHLGNLGFVTSAGAGRAVIALAHRGGGTFERDGALATLTFAAGADPQKPVVAQGSPVAAQGSVVYVSEDRLVAEATTASLALPSEVVTVSAFVGAEAPTRAAIDVSAPFWTAAFAAGPVDAEGRATMQVLVPRDIDGQVAYLAHLRMGTQAAEPWASAPPVGNYGRWAGSEYTLRVCVVCRREAAASRSTMALVRRPFDAARRGLDSDACRCRGGR